MNRFYSNNININEQLINNETTSQVSVSSNDDVLNNQGDFSYISEIPKDPQKNLDDVPRFEADSLFSDEHDIHDQKNSPHSQCDISSHQDSDIIHHDSSSNENVQQENANFDLELLYEDENEDYFLNDEFIQIDLDADYSNDDNSSLDSQEQNFLDSSFETVLPQRNHFRRRSPKRKVDLSEAVQDFRFMFYHVFTNKKKFQKKFVKEIHDIYLHKSFHFNKMTREESRRIDTYFQNLKIVLNIINNCFILSNDE